MSNKKNVFDTCETETDIMRRLFEMSSNKDYTRAELLEMAEERRANITNKEHKLDFKKVIIPETKQYNNVDAKVSTILSGTATTNPVFEFLGEGMVKF